MQRTRSFIQLYLKPKIQQPGCSKTIQKYSVLSNHLAVKHKMNKAAKGNNFQNKKRDMVSSGFKYILSWCHLVIKMFFFQLGALDFQLWQYFQVALFAPKWYMQAIHVLDHQQYMHSFRLCDNLLQMQQYPTLVLVRGCSGGIAPVSHPNTQ